MTTVYGVGLSSHVGHSGDMVYNLFKTFTDAQKAIDTLMWGFTVRGGFCEGASLRFDFDIFIDTEPTTSIDLQQAIVLSGPHGERYPLTDEGILANAKFPSYGVVEIAGRRLTANEFPSFARPWVDWSRVSLDPTPGVFNYTWEDIEEMEIPFGLRDLLVCSPDDIKRFLRCERAWLTADVLGLAKSIRDTGDTSALGVLADALDEAGCDNDWLPWHLRLPAEAHARGNWVVGHLLERAPKPTARKPKAPARGRGQSPQKAKPRTSNKRRKPRNP